MKKQRHITIGGIRIPVSFGAGKEKYTAEEPLRSELFSSEQMYRNAISLAGRHSISAFPKRDHLLDRLDNNEKVLHNVRARLVEAVKNKKQITHAAEWLIDNFYLVEDHILNARKHLPKGYSEGLPQLQSDNQYSLPRIYDIVLQIVSHTDGQIDLQSLSNYIQAYQTVSIIHIGELWAIPIMLRLAIIENLRRLSSGIAIDLQHAQIADHWAEQLVEKNEKDPTNLILTIADMARSNPPLTSSFVGAFFRQLRGKGPDLALALQWIEQQLGETGSSSAERIEAETQKQASNQVSMRNSIGSLRLIGATDWRAFVESHCAVDHVLSLDPVGMYAGMDFTTRDRYRHVIEAIAKKSPKSEKEVAEIVLHLSEQNTGPDPRARHVGYYLIDKGLPQTKQLAGMRETLYQKYLIRKRKYALTEYLLSIFLMTLLLGSMIMFKIFQGTHDTALLVFTSILTILISSEFAISIVNFFSTLFVGPNVLPRMDYAQNVPPHLKTLVVVPSMLFSEEEIDMLTEALEVRYLANRNAHLHFGLLTDFPDAEKEKMPGDDALVAYARKKINALNRKYHNKQLFYLFHRPRHWNPKENVWLGFERKRGKLSELNALLRGSGHDRFSCIVGDVTIFPQIKYVITIDADTQLPLEAAWKLIGNMAHPLNAPYYDPGKKRVTRGYGILQPRVAVSLPDINSSLYARMHGNQPGLDPYTRASSDVYQDLFAEGSFIGKGIYDVDIFKQVLQDTLPENHILSHDLLEGCYVRSGLISDVQLFEKYPSNYLADMQRRSRWIRGDWQIFSWMFPKVPGPHHTKNKNPLSTLSRWKIFDNMRRSLLPFAYTAFLICAWIALPMALYWTITITLIIVFPICISVLWDFLHISKDVRLKHHFSSSFRDTSDIMISTIFTLVCLPFEAVVNGKAILQSSYRMLISKKKLLEWVPSSVTNNKGRKSLANTYRQMAIEPLLSIVVCAYLLLFDPEHLPIAIPILCIWLIAPAITWWTGKPLPLQVAALSDQELIFLRKLSRKTWGYFEHFVSAEDNWLPPDNYQIQPVEEVAHRTSPTNIGLSLLAHVVAKKFHYLSTSQCLERINRTLNTLKRMPRYKGHFYNWYDTKNLNALFPKYVSTVDSGNLVGNLYVLRQALLSIPEAKLIPDNIFEGVWDTYYLLLEALPEKQVSRFRSFGKILKKYVQNPPTDICALIAHRDVLYEECIACFEKLDPSVHSDVHHWYDQLKIQLEHISDDAEILAPVILLEKEKPAFYEEDFYLTAISLHACLQSNQKAAEWANTFDRSTLPAEQAHWLGTFSDAIDRSDKAARERMALIQSLSKICTDLVTVDWSFLYDPSRHLFSIGYNTMEHQMDTSYYDLLASEARLSTFIGIAQGKLPIESWFTLGRMLANVDNSAVLLSWSGSMFEYLMPLLLMPTYENTLLHQSYVSAVQWQIRYGFTHGLPWGISESGYNSLNAHSNYQYRAFGVPGLGLQRGLDEDMVVAPYATALALMVQPEDACANLIQLKNTGLDGPYGLYEAVDYTPSRLQRGQSSAIIYSYLAHHQGMSLLAFAYVLQNKPLQKLFEQEPQFKSALLLLQERIPKQTKYGAHSTKNISDINLSHEGSETRVITTADTTIPEVQLLSNGRFHLMITNAGSGYSRWKEFAITRWREDVTRDNRGTFVYIRNLKSKNFWSNTHQPTLVQNDTYEAAFSQGRVDFRTSYQKLETHTEIVVSPEDDIDMRRIHLTNRSGSRMTIDLTSYAEVVLAPQASDEMQTAFSNLFVQTEILKEQNAIICTRRPRSENEHPPWMFHVVTIQQTDVLESSFETDRALFLGRGNDTTHPAAMSETGPLSNTDGAVLDPIVSVRHKLRIDDDQTVVMHIITGAAESKEACLALISKYRDAQHKDRVFELAWTHSQVVLRQINATESNAQLYGKIAGSIIFPNAAMRADPNVIHNNIRGQSGLWGYSISGDLPIVLLSVKDQDNVQIVQQLVQAHAYWRLKGLMVDLVIWNEAHDVYRRALQQAIQALIPNEMADTKGGIYLRNSDHMSQEDHILFQSVARVYITGDQGTLSEILNRKAPGKITIQNIVVDTEYVPEEKDLSLPEELRFYNGYGGFNTSGDAYILSVSKNKNTPLPWANVLANSAFGTVITERGSAYTWIENAHELRLTPWNNDPVTDIGGEAFYIRDEKTAHFWSPVLFPAGGNSSYIVTHGFGYSTYEHIEDGIYSGMTVFVDLHHAIKYVILSLRNESGRTRSLSATGYMEWVLGTQRNKTAMHVHTHFDSETEALLGSIPYNTDFAPRVAFFDVDASKRSYTCDRTEFIGRNGTLQKPAAMKRKHLAGRTGLTSDPCAALQVFFELAIAEEKEIVFRIGAGKDLSDALHLIRNYRGSENAHEALDAVQAYWQTTRTRIQIKTPDPSLNILSNGWLTYQTMASRLMGRSGYYQSGGAFGFRDQLQDVLSILLCDPHRAKQHILLCASRQFIEGDVQHWWHPPQGNGVRTRCSDDYLWLPYATSVYITHTGDTEILDLIVPYLEGRNLLEGEESYYERPVQSTQHGTLYEHCVKAIRHGLRFGSHGLPLMGTGDWNDGYDKVGAEGKGESVCMGGNSNCPINKKWQKWLKPAPAL